MPAPGVSDGAPSRPRLLVVEDDPPIREVVSRALGLAGFSVDQAGSCAEALAAPSPHVAVVDIALPDGSGIDLCHRLREVDPGVGVIFLTARDTLDDKLTGLALGGDDYITKPFSVAELVTRVGVLMRRVGPRDDPAPAPDGHRSEPASTEDATLRVGDLRLDLGAHQVHRGDRPIELSATEFRLLHCLMRNRGLVLSKEQLLRDVWQYDAELGTGVVEKFISQLRRKVDADADPMLHTVRGFGYTLRPAAPRP